MEWTDITPEQAAQHRLYGLGGWLVAFYALAVLVFAVSFLNFMNIEMLKQFYGEAYVTILVVQLVQTMLYLPFLVLTPLRHPLMPRATITAMWTSIAIGYIAAAAVGGTTLGGPALWVPAVIATVIAALFNWYLNSSRRVNVTYRHRIRADEGIPGDSGVAAA